MFLAKKIVLRAITSEAKDWKKGGFLSFKTYVFEISLTSFMLQLYFCFLT